MRDLSTREVSDIIHTELSKLSYEVILSNITTESIFPCIEMHNPLKSVNKTQNAFPILSTFQFNATCYNNTQRECMDMTHEVDIKLQKYNFTRTNTNTCIFDSVLNKYSMTIVYEVRYNAITDSFEFIR